MNLEKHFLDALRVYNSEIERLRRACQILDQYYIPTRYGTPSGPDGDYSKDQAQEALEQALEIFSFAQNVIKPEFSRS